MAIEPVTREERFLAAAGGQSVTPPEPITRKEQLLQGIIDAVKSGGATPDVIEGAVNDYLNANPVKPGATTEQAAQIEQNKNDIADLQTEVDELKESGGNGSGENAYELPIGGDELGGVKNGGNVTINADGTMTAPDNAPTDEQVGKAVGDWLTAHPEATTTVADKSIGPEKVTDELAGMIYEEVSTEEVAEASETKSGAYINASGAVIDAPKHAVYLYLIPDGATKIGFTAAKTGVNYAGFYSADQISACGADTLVEAVPFSVNAYTEVAAPSGAKVFCISAYNRVPDCSIFASYRRAYSEDIKNLRNALPVIESAVQPDDLLADVPESAQSKYTVEVPTTAGDNAIADLIVQANSADLARQILGSKRMVADEYIHCSVLYRLGDSVWMMAFLNTAGHNDKYDVATTSTELFELDETTGMVLNQYRVAGNGDVAGELTFSTGSGPGNIFPVDDSHFRCVFVAPLSDAGWYQCYRDFDIDTRTFGDIGFCQIAHDGGSEVFNTPNCSQYIQPIANTSLNTNLAGQYATVDGVHYLFVGCAEQWDNMPIVTTPDGITYTYWATPDLPDGKAQYEGAITTDGKGEYIWIAQRQRDSRECVLVANIKIANKSVASKIELPTGSASRPWLTIHGGYLRVWHVLPKARTNGAQIDRVQTNYVNVRISTVSTPPMVYPAVCDLGNGRYMVAYLNEHRQYTGIIERFEPYGPEQVVAAFCKMLETTLGS